MKKILVVLTLLSISVLSLAAFRDIPKGHWAEAYVQKLEEIGVITGFPDGTYRGDEATTRYQIALYIVRTLDYVEGLLNDKQAQIDSLQEKDAYLEDSLVNTYSVLSDAISNQQEELTTRIDNLETRVLNIEDTVATGLPVMRDMIYGLSDDLKNLEDRVTSYTDVRVDELSERLDTLESSTDQLSNRTDLLEEYANQIYDTLGTKADASAVQQLYDELYAEIEKLQNDVAMQFEDVNLTLDLHDQDIIKLYDLINGINDKFVYTDEEGNQQEIDLAGLKSDIDELSMIIDGLAGQLGDVDYALRKQINALAAKDDQLSAKDEELAANIADLSSTIDAIKEQISYLNDSLVNTYSVLSDAIVSQQEELTTTKDEMAASVVNLKEETNDKIGTLEDRVTLLENQTVSLDQIVADTKADKTDVEDLAAKVDNVEKTAGTKAELEQTRQLATWGVVTGVAGIVIGAIAIIGSLQKWF